MFSIDQESLSPAFHDELLTDLKDQSYSLIIDESTDTGTEKQLCVVVIYCSQLKKCIETTFHGIIALESGTAEGIFNAVVQFLDTNKLQVENYIELAIDGCNVMCGSNNSVITKFQAVCPRVVHIRCICHSIQLCSSYVLKTLPHNIEFMVAGHTTGSVTVLFASRNTSNYTLASMLVKNH